jgi:hypothetical protein
MTYEEEIKLVEKLRTLKAPAGVKIATFVTDEEYEICLKHGISEDKIVRSSQGNAGHALERLKSGTGVYTPNKGFYKIVEIRNQHKVPDGRILELALVTNFNSNLNDNFPEEEVLINASPFFNRASIGPKNSSFRNGLVIHVIEETSLVNNTYKVVWEILE